MIRINNYSRPAGNLRMVNRHGRVNGENRPIHVLTSHLRLPHCLDPAVQRFSADRDFKRGFFASQTTAGQTVSGDDLFGGYREIVPDSRVFLRFGRFIGRIAGLDGAKEYIIMGRGNSHGPVFVKTASGEK
jgi:hypothetical protein